MASGRSEGAEPGRHRSRGDAEFEEEPTEGGNERESVASSTASLCQIGVEEVDAIVDGVDAGGMEVLLLTRDEALVRLITGEGWGRGVR